tara:strand:+ start:361 stop:570 length:210 start_codon:yes stop_codon:yes gene_type:complete
MFEVEHEDDAWELGVLNARFFFGDLQAAQTLGVGYDLRHAFQAGMHDHCNLTEERILKFACAWGVINES